MRYWLWYILAALVVYVLISSVAKASGMCCVTIGDLVKCFDC